MLEGWELLLLKRFFTVVLALGLLLSFVVNVSAAEEIAVTHEQFWKDQFEARPGQFVKVNDYKLSDCMNAPYTQLAYNCGLIGAYKLPDGTMGGYPNVATTREYASQARDGVYRVLMVVAIPANVRVTFSDTAGRPAHAVTAMQNAHERGELIASKNLNGTWAFNPLGLITPAVSKALADPKTPAMVIQAPVTAAQAEPQVPNTGGVSSPDEVLDAALAYAKSLRYYKAYRANPPDGLGVSFQPNKGDAGWALAIATRDGGKTYHYAAGDVGRPETGNITNGLEGIQDLLRRYAP